jgi:hypothetical protein
MTGPGAEGSGASSKITILWSLTGEATKRFYLDKHGKVQKRAYSSGKWFGFDTVEVRDIRELSACLAQFEHRSRSFVIRGEPLPGINPARARRLLYADPEDGSSATFRPEPRPWLCIDFDKLPCPAGTDPATDPESAVEYLIGKLPTEFHDASCHWQFSSSQGFAGDTLSAHVWFWLDRPIADDDLRRWAVAFNKTAAVAPDKIIDQALFSPVQVHYTAAPIFDPGVRDPLSRRSGFRRGLEDAVALAVPEKSAAVEYIGARGFDGEPPVGFEGFLDQIGTELGFRHPIVSAVASYIASGYSDFDELKTAIRERLLAADPGGRSDNEIKRYTSDKHLNEIIKWVVDHESEKEQKSPSGASKVATSEESTPRQATHGRQLIPGIEPAFPAEEKPLAVAEAEMEKFVGRFVDQFLEWMNADPLNRPRPPVWVLALPPGVGKSALARQISEKIRALSCRRVNGAVYAKNHKLCEEWARDLRSVMPEYRPMNFAPGTEKHLDVQVIKGRQRERSDGQAMCLKSDVTAEGARRGLNVTETFCRKLVTDEAGNKSVELCERYHDCPFIAMHARRESMIRIYPHAYLTRSVAPLHLMPPPPDFQIIDESFIDQLVEIDEFPHDKLTAVRRWKNVEEELRFRNANSVVSRALNERVPLLTALRSAGITPEDCEKAAELALGKGTEREIHPSQPAAEQRKKLESLKRSRSFSLHRMWKALGSELALPFDRAKSRCVVHRWHATKERWLVVIRRRSDLNLSNVPTLILDADANEDVLRTIFPTLQVTRLDVERNAHVVQVCDRRAGTYTLTADNPKARKRIADVQRLIDRRAQAVDVRVLVNGPLAVRKLLKLPPGVAYAHNNSLLGLNAHSKCEEVIVVGRNQAPITAYEDMTAALLWDEGRELATIEDGKLLPAVRGYRMASGEKVGRDLLWAVHPEPLTQALIELSRERQIVQAADRIRAVRAQRPKRIWLLSDLPAPITVHELRTWDEVVDGGTRLEQAWDRTIAAGGRALPITPKHLSNCFPDLFSSEEAAKLHLKRPAARRWLETLQGGRTLIESLYKGATPLPALAAYRAQGQTGSEARALVDGRLSAGEARVALESALGSPVIAFRLERSGEPAGPQLGITQAPVAPAALMRAPPALLSAGLVEVMPFVRHALGAVSEIIVRQPYPFPELLCWSADGQRPAGWNFWLRLPPTEQAAA